MVSHYGVGAPELHAGHGHVGSRIGERGWITRLLALPPLAPGPPMAPTDSRYCWRRRSYLTPTAESSPAFCHCDTCAAHDPCVEHVSVQKILRLSLSAVTASRVPRYSPAPHRFGPASISISYSVHVELHSPLNVGWPLRSFAGRLSA
jgi:hypothetical protein